MEQRFQPNGNGRTTATTAQVLGRARAVDPKFQRFYDRLVAVREELLNRRGDLGKIAPVEELNHSVNLADRASDEYDMSAQFGLFSSEQDALFEIDLALRRIGDGTYGICEATGKPIAEDRLEAIPWTRYAKEVEAEVERERQSRKVQHIL
jgi:RNA polymerase-binding transcription factor DksA